MASKRAAWPRAPPFVDPPGSARNRPEATLLYRRVERHYRELAAAREGEGRPLRRRAFKSPSRLDEHWAPATIAAS